MDAQRRRSKTPHLSTNELLLTHFGPTSFKSNRNHHIYAQIQAWRSLLARFQRSNIPRLHKIRFLSSKTAQLSSNPKFQSSKTSHLWTNLNSKVTCLSRAQRSKTLHLYINLNLEANCFEATFVYFRSQPTKILKMRLLKLLLLISVASPPRY